MVQIAYSQLFSFSECARHNVKERPEELVLWSSSAVAVCSLAGAAAMLTPAGWGLAAIAALASAAIGSVGMIYKTLASQPDSPGCYRIAQPGFFSKPIPCCVCNQKFDPKKSSVPILEHKKSPIPFAVCAPCLEEVYFTRFALLGDTRCGLPIHGHDCQVDPISTADKMKMFARRVFPHMVMAPLRAITPILANMAFTEYFPTIAEKVNALPGVSYISGFPGVSWVGNGIGRSMFLGFANRLLNVEGWLHFFRLGRFLPQEAEPDACAIGVLSGLVLQHKYETTIPTALATASAVASLWSVKNIIAHPIVSAFE